MLDFKIFGLSTHNVGFMSSDWLVFAMVADEMDTLTRLRRSSLHILTLGMLLCCNILSVRIQCCVFDIQC